MQCRPRLRSRRNEASTMSSPTAAAGWITSCTACSTSSPTTPGPPRRCRVFPLYSLPTDNTPLGDALFYTTRRLAEARDAAGAERSARGPAMSARKCSCRCASRWTSTRRSGCASSASGRCVSNRHLTEQLPVGEAGTDFHLVDNTSLPLRCLAGPTAPRRIRAHDRAPATHRQRRPAPSPGG